MNRRILALSPMPPKISYPNFFPIAHSTNRPRSNIDINITSVDRNRISEFVGDFVPALANAADIAIDEYATRLFGDIVAHVPPAQVVEIRRGDVVVATIQNMPVKNEHGIAVFRLADAIGIMR